jgi:hypothetical protein
MKQELNIERTKLDLIQWLSTIDNVEVLNKLLAFRKEENADWWHSISEKEKQLIETGLKDSEAGNVKPHSEAKKLYEKWL